MRPATGALPDVREGVACDIALRGWAKHFTKELEAFALTMMREMPVKKAVEILGEQDTRMWRVVLAYVDEAYAKGMRHSCRNARIVYDKFHVIAHTDEAVDRVRRDEAQSG